MDWPVHLPALWSIGISFSVILLATRLKVPLGIAMISGALLLILAGGKGPKGVPDLLLSFLRPENWLLFIVIPLDLLLTGLLEKTGRMRQTVEALRAAIARPRTLYAAMPAMIGLLPMPGGAVFSAPLVEALDTKKLSADLKGAVNYWFRHVWELWWPLYPGVVLALKYTGYTAGAFAVLLAPLMLVSIAAGWFFILRKIPVRSNDFKKGPIQPFMKRVHDLSAALLPIGLVIAATIILAPLFSKKLGLTTATANFSALLAGLAAANILVLIRAPRWQDCRDLLTGKQSRSLLVIVAGIIAFSSALQLPLDNSETLITTMRDELLAIGLPPWPVLMTLPLIAGFITGITMAFVGATFPIIYAFAANDPAATSSLAAITVVAYISGYFGMMLSPVHLCLLVSADYFKGSLRALYRRIAAPAVVLLTAGLVLGALWYTFGKDTLLP